jgi:hypothetical protein
MKATSATDIAINQGLALGLQTTAGPAGGLSIRKLAVAAPEPAGDTGSNSGKLVSSILACLFRCWGML